MIHTFFSYIEVQLLVVASIAVVLLHKRPVMGAIFCAACFAAGSLALALVIHRYNVIPHLVTSQTSTTYDPLARATNLNTLHSIDCLLAALQSDVADV